MIYLDQTCMTPAENLELDERLLDRVDHDGGSFLRVWEPAEWFVILGRGNQADREVDLSACGKRDIPVLRRSSGGGAVLLGPGCLCYSIILPIESDTRLFSSKSTNEWILERISRSLSGLSVAPIETRGDSDLTLGDRKIAGHAQRRKRNALLFHGSLLLNFDPSPMETFLRAPSRSPEYRQNRAHAGFVTNLPVPAAKVKQALKSEWLAHEDTSPGPPIGEVPVGGEATDRTARVPSAR
jgi:lipoate---protein ligase